MSKELTKISNVFFFIGVLFLITSSCSVDKNNTATPNNCNGFSLNIDYDYSSKSLYPIVNGGTPPLQYIWENAGVTDLDGNYYDPLPGEYTLKVIDHNLCEANATYNVNGFLIGYRNIKIDGDAPSFNSDDVVLSNINNGYFSIGTQASLENGSARIIIENHQNDIFVDESEITGEDLKTGNWSIRLEFDDDSFYTSVGADFQNIIEYGTIDIDYMYDNGESGVGIDAISISFNNVKVRHGAYDNDEVREITGNVLVDWI